MRARQGSARRAASRRFAHLHVGPRAADEVLAGRVEEREALDDEERGRELGDGRLDFVGGRCGAARGGLQLGAPEGRELGHGRRDTHRGSGAGCGGSAGAGLRAASGARRLRAVSRQEGVRRVSQQRARRLERAPSGRRGRESLRRTVPGDAVLEADEHVADALALEPVGGGLGRLGQAEGREQAVDGAEGPQAAGRRRAQGRELRGGEGRGVSLGRKERRGGRTRWDVRRRGRVRGRQAGRSCGGERGGEG